MGLDMYAYSKDENGEETNLADWRKHNRLHGWMEQLWEDKGRPYDGDLDDFDGNFNCVALELTLTDLEQLEAEIANKTLPASQGFFWGSDSFEWEEEEGKPYDDNDYYYKENDLQFIEDARKAIQKGEKVFYNSWW